MVPSDFGEMELKTGLLVLVPTDFGENGTKSGIANIWYHKRASKLEPNGSFLAFGSKGKQANWNQIRVYLHLVPKESKRIGTKFEFTCIWFHKRASELEPSSSLPVLGTIKEQANWNQTEVFLHLIPRKSKRIGTKRKFSCIWFQKKAGKVELKSSLSEFRTKKPRKKWN